MWKEDLSLPRSATRHVAVDNLNFVMNLRKDDFEKPPTRPRSAMPAISKKSHVNEEEEKKLFKEQFRETGCKNSLCLIVEEELVRGLLEKRELTDHLSEGVKALASDEEFYHQMNQEYSVAHARQEELLRRLTLLDIDFSKKVEKFQKLKEDQLQLEDQISRKRAELRGLVDAKEAKKKDSIIQENNRKHNGIYTTALTGKGQWSCCLAEDIQARGCIDDCSVGVKSKLGHVKNVFYNYVNAPVLGSTSVWKEPSSTLPLPSKVITFKKSGDVTRNGSQISIRPSSSHQMRHHQNLHQHSHSHTHLPHSDSLHTNTWISNHDKSQLPLPRGTNNSEIRRASFANLETSFNISQHNESHLNHQSLMITSKESIGKVRPSSSSRLVGNRPMSSPGGFQLYQQS